MARINVEEAWWSDPRRSKLIRLLGGDTRTADGLAIEAWRLAQEFWKHNRTLIPRGHFEALEGFNLLIESNLAALIDDQIYVKGSSQYLEWAKEEREKAKRGGQTSAQRPRDDKGRLLPTIQAESKQSPSEVQAKSKQIQASDSDSDSVSDSNENTKYKESIGETAIAVVTSGEEQNLSEKVEPRISVPKKSKFNDLTRQKMQTFIAAYAKGYKKKYQGSPEGIKDKALIGKLGHWIEHVSEVRAINLIEAYLQISYRPFDESYHDLWQFFRHLNRIGVALDTGKDANSIDWSTVFAGGAA